VTPSTRERGQAVESRVAAELAARGLEIVARNVTLAGGEIDLVAREPGRAPEPDTVVFVEVRSRSGDACGGPLETIDANKRSRIVRAATAWLVREGLWERVAVRFDVVGVTGEGEGALEWIRDAFDATGPTRGA
jgi:putative endonuclease